MFPFSAQLHWFANVKPILTEAPAKSRSNSTDTTAAKVSQIRFWKKPRCPYCPCRAFMSGDDVNRFAKRTPRGIFSGYRSLHGRLYSSIRSRISLYRGPSTSSYLARYCFHWTNADRRFVAIFFFPAEHHHDESAAHCTSTTPNLGDKGLGACRKSAFGVRNNEIF